MRLKADWFTYLHEFRVREFRVIFDRFPPAAFDNTLELGAGDGFQSGLLLPYTDRLVSTDYRVPAEAGDPRIEVRALPAEQVADAFAPGEFDVVYSSNMLEHVPEPPVVLKAVSQVLADDGITIHVMPNRAWKLCQLILWIPHLAASALDDLITARSVRTVVARLRKSTGEPGSGDGGTEKNNPTVVRPRRSLLRKVLAPEPHGVSPDHREEFAAFSRRRWERELRDAGFDIVAVLPGPFSSGYGFGLRPVTRMLEQLGIGSEYVFVAKKAGQVSRYEGAFTH